MAPFMLVDFNEKMVSKKTKKQTKKNAVLSHYLSKPEHDLYISYIYIVTTFFVATINIFDKVSIGE